MTNYAGKTIRLDSESTKLVPKEKPTLFSRSQRVGVKEPYFCTINDMEIIYGIDRVVEKRGQNPEIHQYLNIIKRNEKLRAALSLSSMSMMISGDCTTEYRVYRSDGSLEEKPYHHKEGVGGYSIFFTYRNAKTLVSWLEAELGIEVEQYGTINSRHLRNEDAGILDN